MRPRDNPYRSERMDGLPYRLRGADWATLIERVRAGGWLEVVGPHGAGKTRLLEELARRLPAAGVPTRYARVGPGGQDVSRSMFNRERALLIDGLEAAPRRAAWRVRLALATGRARAVVVARHVGGRARRLYTCAPDYALARELVDALDPASAPDDASLRALLAGHEGNLRAVFRALYDRAAGLPSATRRAG
ncbi:MAG: hypothetical protein H6713_26650 [Myxococcales bacterium]|nr:hypothetical protein [Myxococcales bacterium]